VRSEDAVRDERTTSVENASYRWAYLALSFGLLLDTAYRALVRQEAGWDLLALVLLGGLVTTLYQAANKILTRRWALMGFAVALVAAVVAAAIALMR